MTNTLDHEQNFDLAFDNLDKFTDEQLKGAARSAFLNLFPIYEDSRLYDVQVMVIRQRGKATATVKAWKRPDVSPKK